MTMSTMGSREKKLLKENYKPIGILKKYIKCF